MKGLNNHNKTVYFIRPAVEGTNKILFYTVWNRVNNKKRQSWVCFTNVTRKSKDQWGSCAVCKEPTEKYFV